MADTQVVLQVDDLKTYFPTYDGLVRAVDGVSFKIRKGEVLGVVGESGCGKSVTAASVLQIVSPPGKVSGGKILFNKDGHQIDIAGLSPNDRKMRRIRGNDIAMIFQEPMTAFSPVFTIGNQISEAIRLHQGVNKKGAREKAIHLLDHVGIAAAAKRFDQYPLELSGGMRQRAMIAMALSCDPVLLIADEPTTALDVTIQAQILTLLRELQHEHQMAIMLITHDLGVIAEMADRVAVMYLGEIVEQTDVRSLFHDPKHPYTVGLLNSIPMIDLSEKRELDPIKGSVPNAMEIMPGCRFIARCPYRFEACSSEVLLKRVGEDHDARCWLYG